MKSLTASAVVDAGKASALTTVLSLTVGFVPLVSVLALPLLPLPTAFVALKWGERAALVAAAVAALLGWLLTGPVNGFMTLVLAAGLGAMLGGGLRRNWGPSRLLWASGCAAALGLAAWVGLSWFLSGLTVEQLRSLMETSFQTVSGMYQSAGIDQASIDQALNSARSVFALLPYLLPGVVLSLGVVLAVVAVAVAGLVFPKLGRPLSSSLSLQGLRLHWMTPYGVAAGLVLVMVGPRLETGGRALWLTGINVLLLFGTVLFVQGLAVTSWFANVRARSGGGRAAVYALALLGQLLFLLLTWVGLIDVWLDVRKRYERRDPRRPDGAPVAQRDVDEEETEWK